MYEVDHIAPHYCCPHCGYEVLLVVPALDSILLKTVKKLARHSGMATSKAIALEVCLSKSQVNRRLARLAQLGQVVRVSPRGGWRIAA
jgi:predicted transcriptional regulator